MGSPASPSSSPAGLGARGLTLVGAGLLLAAAFLPWTGEEVVAIDLGLFSLGDRFAQPTLGLTLVALAAVPALWALSGDQGWPRAVVGIVTGLLVVTWLAAGPDGALSSGVLVATIAAAVLLLSGAVATGPDRPSPAEHRPPVAVEHRLTPIPRAEEVAAGAGGRHVLHARGDAVIAEVWGATRSDLLTHLVHAVVAVYAPDLPTSPATTQAFDLPPLADDELAARLVRRALRTLDLGRVAVRDVALTDRFDGGVTGRFGLVLVTEPPRRSPVPTDVATDQFTIRRVGSTWHATLRLDA